jgi:hypothetical protein
MQKNPEEWIAYHSEARKGWKIIPYEIMIERIEQYLLASRLETLAAVRRKSWSSSEMTAKFHSHLIAECYTSVLVFAIFIALI